MQLQFAMVLMVSRVGSLSKNSADMIQEGKYHRKDQPYSIQTHGDQSSDLITNSWPHDAEPDIGKPVEPNSVHYHGVIVHSKEGLYNNDMDVHKKTKTTVKLCQKYWINGLLEQRHIEMEGENDHTKLPYYKNKHKGPFWKYYADKNHIQMDQVEQMNVEVGPIWQHFQHEHMQHTSAQHSSKTKSCPHDCGCYYCPTECVLIDPQNA